MSSGLLKLAVLFYAVHLGGILLYAAIDVLKEARLESTPWLWLAAVGLFFAVALPVFLATLASLLIWLFVW